MPSANTPARDQPPIMASVNSLTASGAGDDHTGQLAVSDEVIR
jgi:hypothetical protein